MPIGSRHTIFGLFRVDVTHGTHLNLGSRICHHTAALRLSAFPQFWEGITDVLYPSILSWLVRVAWSLISASIP